MCKICTGSCIEMFADSLEVPMIKKTCVHSNYKQRESSLNLTPFGGNGVDFCRMLCKA